MGGQALAIPLEMERLTGHRLGGEKLAGACRTGSKLCGAQGLFLELPSSAMYVSEAWGGTHHVCGGRLGWVRRYAGGRCWRTHGVPWPELRKKTGLGHFLSLLPGPCPEPLKREAAKRKPKRPFSAPCYLASLLPGTAGAGGGGAGNPTHSSTHLEGRTLSRFVLLTFCCCFPAEQSVIPTVWRTAVAPPPGPTLWAQGTLVDNLTPS